MLKSHNRYFTEYEYLLSQFDLYPKKDFIYEWNDFGDECEFIFRRIKESIIKSCNKWYKKI